jgi:cellulose biosynthesis protein BcsQ
MRSLAFFNNKGGVGKTTLTCNLASYLATERNLKVLLIDGDPQCNSTQLLLSPEQCNDLYWAEDRDGDALTLSKVVAPLEEGDIRLDTSRSVVGARNNRFGVDLIPGDPGMAIVEDLLGKWWSDSAGGDLGALRKTNWTSLLLEAYDNYDLVIFDLGPSLGSLNRSILLATDYFVAPLGADTFSVVALRNIKIWLNQWGGSYAQSLGLAKQSFGDRVDLYPIQAEPKIKSGFVGYTVQQYITRSKEGVRRPTQAYERILGKIPSEISDTLAGFRANHVEEDDLRLGDIPNLYSLIPLAQDVNAPIADLRSSDGITGGQFSQQKDYKALMESVGAALANNLGF